MYCLYRVPADKNFAGEENRTIKRREQFLAELENTTETEQKKEEKTQQKLLLLLIPIPSGKI